MTTIVGIQLIRVRMTYNLLSDSSNDLATWLQRYVVSTRKKSGEKYPAKTVYLLLCGLQRHMKEKKAQPFNIFDRDHPDFKVVFRTNPLEGHTDRYSVVFCCIFCIRQLCCSCTVLPCLLLKTFLSPLKLNCLAVS